MRLLFDATSTLYTGHSTGVQRVVLSLERELKELCQVEGVLFETLYFNGKQYQCCSPEMRHKLSCRKSLQKSLSRCPKLIQATYRMSVALFLRTPLATFWRHFRTPCLHDEPFPFSSDDILLLADATWNYDPWAQVDRAKALGVRVHTIIYDLLPLKHPDYFQPLLRENFARWWKNCRIKVSSFLCISAAVQKDVEARLPVDAKAQTFVFPLGFDFLRRQEKLAVPFISSSLSWERDVVFLSVGTLEPRKNHSYILDAFDQIWFKKPEAKLILVGREGWFCEKTIERIKGHVFYGRRLFWLSNCSDEELESLYAYSDALIAASKDEGYGLPLVEAAAKGIPVLASDIPVFHEVALSGARFFSLASSDSLATLIKGVQKRKMEESLEILPLASWQDSARFVFRSIFGQQSS